LSIFAKAGGGVVKGGGRAIGKAAKSLRGEVLDFLNPFGGGGGGSNGRGGGIEIEVDQKSLDKLLRKLTGDHLWGEPLEDYIQESGEIILERLRRDVPRDTGDLAGSIEDALGRTSGEIRIASDHAGYVLGSADAHQGAFNTRPHFPPRSAIEGWARRHGVAPFLVQRAIAKRGTKIDMSLTDALRTYEGAMDRLADKMAHEICKRWAK